MAIPWWRKVVQSQSRVFKPSARLRARSRSYRPYVELLEARELLDAVSQRFVGQLYRDLLQREAPPAELPLWGGILDQGTSRVQVARQIEGSGEYQGLVVQGLYNALLHRAADQGGLSAFTSALAQRSTIEQVAANLAGSAEYFSGASFSRNLARQDITIWQVWRSSLGTGGVSDLGGWDARSQRLGGWSLDVHHVYDPVGRVLLGGDGSRQAADALPVIISTAAGSVASAGDGGPATQAQFDFPQGVAMGADGSLYIADQYNHRIRQIRPDGTIATVAGNGTLGFSGDGGPATQAQFNAPQGVAVGPDGSLYVVDTSSYRVRRVGPNGIITTVAGNGTSGFGGDGGPATQAQLLSPSGVTVGADGSLYIGEVARIRKVRPDGIIMTVAGNGTYGYSGDGGAATQAQITSAKGLAVGPDGSLYIADRFNYRVRRVGPDGIIATVAGNGTQGFGGDGGPATQAQLQAADYLALGPDGSLYIADTSNDRVRRVTPGGIITTFAGNGTFGYSGDGGPATQAQIGFPEGIALRSDGSVWFADSFHIRRVRPDGVITTAAGTGNFPLGGDGGPASQAQFTWPQGVATGPDGSLYIADSFNNRIRRVGANGIVTTVAGGSSSGALGDGGPASQAQLSSPQGVGVGPDGSLYFVEFARIRRIRPDGIITTVAGTGISGFSGDGGPAAQAQLSFPQGIAVGSDGSIYVSEPNNQRVRRVGPDGIISTVAGTGISGYGGDGGPATQAKLNQPSGVAVGPDGSLYIVDRFGYRVRRVGLDGIITTVAGTGTIGTGGDGGPATQAQLAPVAVAVAADGNLYVADNFNNRVRRVGPDGIIVTVAGNGRQGFSGDLGPATQAQLAGPTWVAVGPDGNLYVTETLNHRIRRLSQPLPGVSVTDTVIPAENGTEVYVFNAAGKHQRTLDALTGAIRYQFTYDSAGRLSAVTDVDGNVTSVQRDASGSPTALVAPFGQRTTLAVNADGYLSAITDSASQTVGLAYATGGLLSSYTDPRGNVHRFSYDAQGRLARDDDPASGFTTLVRSVQDRGFTVTKTTALGRTTTYQIAYLTTGQKQVVTTTPDGLNTTVLTGTDDSQIVTYPDGTTAMDRLGPDPRFGMMSPPDHFPGRLDPRQAGFHDFRFTLGELGGPEQPPEPEPPDRDRDGERTDLHHHV